MPAWATASARRRELVGSIVAGSRPLTVPVHYGDDTHFISGDIGGEDCGELAGDELFSS